MVELQRHMQEDGNESAFGTDYSIGRTVESTDVITDRAADDNTAVRPKDSPEDDSGGVVAGKRVLVVDDVETNRMILVRILSMLGAECEEACNGREAVGQFENSPAGAFDLILMDVQMPCMDGYAAAKAIRSGKHPQAESISIIAMTADAFADDIRTAVESGMDAHIAKPVQPDKMQEVIRQVFDRKKEREK